MQIPPNVLKIIDFRAAVVALTSTATAVPPIMQERVSERWLAMATARQISRRVTGKLRNRVSWRRV